MTERRNKVHTIDFHPFCATHGLAMTIATSTATGDPMRFADGATHITCIGGPTRLMSTRKQRDTEALELKAQIGSQFAPLR